MRKDANKRKLPFVPKGNERTMVVLIALTMIATIYRFTKCVYRGRTISC